MTWAEEAACRDMPKTAFFPRQGDTRQSDAAKAVCRRCPVRAECAEAGRNESHGVWGGGSPGDRGKRGGGASTVAVRVHGTIQGYRQHQRYEERPCRDCRDAHHSHEARLWVPA